MISDQAAERHIDYYRQFHDAPQERDKVTLSLLNGLKGKLLDIGCSEGVFLRHVQRRFPHFDLYGGDAHPIRIETAKRTDIKANFSVMSITAIEGKYDVIVVNAVFMILDDEAFIAGLQSIGRALNPGGTLIMFEPLNPYSQTLEVTEKSVEYPNGHRLYIRDMHAVTMAMKGYSSINITPFEIPIDLPIDHSQHIRTHTVKTADWKRLQFRGALYTPWCHVVAVKGH